MQTQVKVCFLTLGLIISASGIAKPKYGPEGAPRATPLAFANQFFRENPAPDFWALIGFYLPQKLETCSAASLAMVLNGLMINVPKDSETKNFNASDVVKKMNVPGWNLSKPTKKEIAQGFISNCPSLVQYSDIVDKALQVYKVSGGKRETYYADSKTFKADFMRLLKKNESSVKDFIIINFVQKAATDDYEGGHISPIGAYDEKTGKALVLDTDREYYEPYWVSVDHLLEGMNTKNPDEKNYRGFMYIYRE